jgi:hypothetical protein
MLLLNSFILMKIVIISIFLASVNSKIIILLRNIHKQDQIMITILITVDVLVKEDFA